MSRSAVSRLISTLIHVGFVRRVAGGRQFELAPGAFGVGHAYLSTNPITGAAEPLMQQLADRLDVSVALAVPDHLDMLYIAYRYTAGVSTLQLGVGSLLPMGLTAIGRAWLWTQPETSRNRYVEQPWRRPVRRRANSGSPSTRLSAIWKRTACAWRSGNINAMRTALHCRSRWGARKRTWR